MPVPFPGIDSNGFRDPQSILHMVFASTAARDAWITANGGVALFQGKGFLCIVDTGAAWNLYYLNAAGAWKTVALA